MRKFQIFPRSIYNFQKVVYLNYVKIRIGWKSPWVERAKSFFKHNLSNCNFFEKYTSRKYICIQRQFEVFMKYNLKVKLWRTRNFSHFYKGVTLEEKRVCFFKWKWKKIPVYEIKQNEKLIRITFLSEVELFD